MPAPHRCVETCFSRALIACFRMDLYSHTGIKMSNVRLILAMLWWLKGVKENGGVWKMGVQYVTTKVSANRMARLMTTPEIRSRYCSKYNLFHEISTDSSCTKASQPSRYDVT